MYALSVARLKVREQRLARPARLRNWIGVLLRRGKTLKRHLAVVRAELIRVEMARPAGVSVSPGISLASLSASAAGAIAYGTGSMRGTQFAWFDRSDTRLETVGPSDQTNLAHPALSPDGRQVAFSRVVGGNWDICLMNLQGR